MSPAGAPRPVPLLLLGESRQRGLVERVARIVADWHATWASEGVPAPLVEPAAAAPRPASAGRHSLALAATADDELLLYVDADTDFVKALCVSSFRERLSVSFASPRGRLEGALTEEAVGALATSLVRAALPSTACAVRKCGPVVLEEAGSAWRRCSFRVRVSAGVAEGGPALELDLAPRLAEALLGGRPAVAKPEALAVRRQAVEAEQLTVTISLGSASVSWRDLNGLSIGDAIVLEQDLGAPCTLAVGRSKPVAEAHLGRVGDTLAVQITRIHPQERRERR